MGKFRTLVESAMNESYRGEFTGFYSAGNETHAEFDGRGTAFLVNGQFYPKDKDSFKRDLEKVSNVKKVNITHEDDFGTIYVNVEVHYTSDEGNVVETAIVDRRGNMEHVKKVNGVSTGW